MLLTRIAICACAALFLSSSPTLAAREVHIVGLHEGNLRTGGQLHGPQMKLTVDRPEQDVVLVLSAQNPVRWKLTLTPGTRLERIVFGGGGADRHEVFVGEEPFAGPIDRNSEIPFFHSLDGGPFRRAVDLVTEAYAVDRLSSGYAAYKAPVEGSVVNSVDPVDIRLADDHLGPIAATVTQVPVGFIDALCPGSRVPPAVLTGGGFLIRRADCTTVQAAVTLDVPRISWPVDAVVLPGEQAVYGVTLGGEGYLYRYDLSDGSWSIAATMDRFDAHDLFHDIDGGRLVMTGGSGSFSGIRAYDLETGVLSVLPGGPEALPGYFDLVDEDRMTREGIHILALRDNRLLVGNGPEARLRARDQEPIGTERIWSIDLITGQGQLLSYAPPPENRYR